MAELIAVNDIFSLVDFSSFKRQALMFDRIAFPDLRKAINLVVERHPVLHPFLRELDWLQEQGIVFEPDLHVSAKDLSQNEEYQRFYELYWSSASEIDSFYGVKLEDLVVMDESNQPAITDEGYRASRMLNNLIGLQARKASIIMRLFKSLDAYPILSSLVPPIEDGETDKSHVLQVLIKEFPVPDDQTPWEYIQDFRSDPNAQTKFLALKKWINELARMKLPRNEIEDELKARMSEYETQMRTHRIKSKWDTLKIIACSEAGFLTTAKLTGWEPFITAAGAILSPLFSLKQQQIKLLQAEQQAPGKEVAYIVKAKETF